MQIFGGTNKEYYSILENGLSLVRILFYCPETYPLDSTHALSKKRDITVMLQQPKITVHEHITCSRSELL